MDLQPAGDTLGVMHAEVFERECAAQQAAGALGDGDRARLGQPLNARRDIRCLANRQLGVGALVGATLTNHH